MYKLLKFDTCVDLCLESFIEHFNKNVLPVLGIMIELSLRRYRGIRANTTVAIIRITTTISMMKGHFF